MRQFLGRSLIQAPKLATQTEAGDPWDPWEPRSEYSFSFFRSNPRLSPFSVPNQLQFLVINNMALFTPSVPTPGYGRDSTSLPPSDSDRIYEKQVNRLREVSQQLALGCSRIKDHRGVMCGAIGQLFGKLAAVDSTVALDVRIALLQTLATLWEGACLFEPLLLVDRG